MFIQRTKTEARNLARDIRAAIKGAPYRRYIEVRDDMPGTPKVVVRLTRDHTRYARYLADRLVKAGFRWPGGHTEGAVRSLANEMYVAVGRQADWDRVYGAD